MQSTTIEVAPARLPSSLKGLGLIYGAAIASCFLVNLIVQAAPIRCHGGPPRQSVLRGRDHDRHLVIALLFGFGLDRPYPWAGQKTPGSWEDVD